MYFGDTLVLPASPPSRYVATPHGDNFQLGGLGLSSALAKAASSSANCCSACARRTGAPLGDLVIGFSGQDFLFFVSLTVVKASSRKLAKSFRSATPSCCKGQTDVICAASSAGKRSNNSWAW